MQRPSKLDNMRRDMYSELSEISVTIARIDERTKDLPELKQRVHELHTYVTKHEGASQVWSTTSKWVAGVTSSLLIAGIIAVVGHLI